MLISQEYLELQRQMHEHRTDYGIVGRLYAEQVREIVKAIDAKTILDYGAGKQTLSKALSAFPIRDYDPAVPGLEALPEPAELVVCTDVLEHIEPDCLNDVLDDLRRLAVKAIFVTIATRPAVKFLSDGRNAHLIQKPLSWWAGKIEERWDIVRFQGTGGEFMVFAVPKP